MHCTLQTTYSLVYTMGIVLLPNHFIGQIIALWTPNLAINVFVGWMLR